jgi:tetratricopeptide (TPR) repeat protein
MKLFQNLKKFSSTRFFSKNFLSLARLQPKIYYPLEKPTPYENFLKNSTNSKEDLKKSILYSLKLLKYEEIPSFVEEMKTFELTKEEEYILKVVNHFVKFHNETIKEEELVEILKENQNLDNILSDWITIQLEIGLYFSNMTQFSASLEIFGAVFIQLLDFLEKNPENKEAQNQFVSVLLFLARTHFFMRNFEESMKSTKSALDILKTQNNENHLYLLFAKKNLGDCHFEQQNFEEAEILLEESKKISDEIMSKEIENLEENFINLHISMLYSLCRLRGSFYFNQFEESLELAKQSVEFSKKYSNITHQLESNQLLISILIGMKKYNEANDLGDDSERLIELLLVDETVDQITKNILIFQHFNQFKFIFHELGMTEKLTLTIKDILDYMKETEWNMDQLTIVETDYICQLTKNKEYEKAEKYIEEESSILPMFKNLYIGCLLELDVGDEKIVEVALKYHDGKEANFERLLYDHLTKLGRIEEANKYKKPFSCNIL